ITDIKLAEQALRESEARFQLATEIGRSGTWDWDLSSGEIIWSRGHYEILGYRVGEVMPSSQAWTDRVHPEDRPGIEAVLQRAMAGHQGHAGHQDYVIEFRVVWPDGSIHWMSAHGRYEYTKNGTCRRMIGVMADVTSLKQAELALLEADRRKDEFLAMLAHELRNPLAPIRNAAHVLGRLETQEPHVEWVRKTIERQVDHLTRLVDDLLDVSRIVRGKVTLRPEPVELAAVVNQALDMARPLIDARGHRIAVSLPVHGVQLEGDPVRLAQVLLNLLDNAAKYTPEGGRITLNGSAFGQVIEIRVSDNGVGIPAELLPRIFDLFQQGERTLDRSQGGLGIGLTLVKRL
ncbi:MAG: PAS domain-containing protein, partial [Deltaproteobacteria bacterium]|nr:PAS domain-containing protein [Deltaproteobacteria bacterium]